jgi:hypothetical protein
MSDAVRAMIGALRLMRFDASGLDWFDRTPQGFARSFAVALPILPVHLWLSRLPGPPDADAGLRLLLAMLVYIVLWLAFPVAMLPVVDALGRRARYFDFMVANNWMAAPLIALQALLELSLITLPVPTVLASLAGLGLFVYALAVEWFTVRRALAVSGVVAFGVTLLDTLLSQLILSIV